MQILESSKLRIWVGLQVPSAYLEAFEQADIMFLCKLLRFGRSLMQPILVHLIGRENMWNQKFCAIQRGSELRTSLPMDLLELGAVILKHMVLNFEKAVANK